MLTIKAKNITHIGESAITDKKDKKHLLNRAKPMDKPPLPQKNSIISLYLDRNIKTLRHEYICDQRK